MCSWCVQSLEAHLTPCAGDAEVTPPPVRPLHPTCLLIYELKPAHSQEATPAPVTCDTPVHLCYCVEALKPRLSAKRTLNASHNLHYMQPQKAGFYLEKADTWNGPDNHVTGSPLT